MVCSKRNMKRIILVGIISVLLWIGCTEEQSQIEITYPADGSVVSRIVNITVETVNDIMITRVEFYVNDSLEYTTLSSPFIYSWNTFALPDSSLHEIYAKGYYGNLSEDISDTIFVMVDNGPFIFADDFELYSTGEYPLISGWYELRPGANSESTYVQSGISHNGDKSFKLSGSSSWPRTDGVELSLTGFHQLTYEFAVMIPSNSSTGALVGFFVQVSPTLGEIFNGVLFNYEDGLVHVRGVEPVGTGYVWKKNTWHLIKVVLDYDNLLMNVWLDNEQIATNIQAATRDTSNIFAVATERGASGIVYYDDIEIYE